MSCLTQLLYRPFAPPSDAEKRHYLNVATEVLQVLETSQTQPFIEFKIHWNTYYLIVKILEYRLLRFDYDPGREILAIRMPCPVHDFFSASLVKHIQEQLKSIAGRSDQAGEFASNIHSGGSSRILLREGLSETSRPLRRQPDAQFQHERAAYPGVVIEVSYSQDGKNLRKLAEDYILYSNGDIKLVIGIDINYQDQYSTVSTWRPRYTPQDEGHDILDAGQDIAIHPFRSSKGVAINENGDIPIDLCDFATDEISSGNESASTTVPFSLLVQFLGQAERIQQAREENASVKSRRQTSKRKLSSSSAEELGSSDEDKFLDKERQAADRAATKDKDFVTKEAKRRAA
ncbi:hypothetical protein S40288_05989 [Stachybotrys chartarum IBT 40288]|nr:hypothetical protein S40288_05989 [Stachybotrys chartarum IBT 40288]